MELARRDLDPGEPEESAAAQSASRRTALSVHNATQWLHNRNHSPGAVALVRRARRL
ncbi:adenylate/guanylate cyclase domain-containing protein, partial [Mycobacterium avium subsp. hominissuis]|nr:adenylate/guanylate cyclase domain-containing protein [Mycobacterium avium subsp. hominissuis]